MSTVYPYRARAMMRFKAQDGQFVLSPDQVVTVTAITDEDGDWVNVENDEGQSGSVPSGFLVAIEDQVKEVGEKDQLAATPMVKSASGSIELPTSTTAVSPPSLEPEAVLSNPSKPPTEIEPTEAISTIPKLESAEQPSVPPNAGPTDPPVSAQTSSKPEEVASTPSTLPPPPPPSKPNALRDRIAMFNKAPSASQPAAPGPLRPKPPLARKPLNMPPPAPPVSTSDGKEDTPATAEGNSFQSNAPTGMSAADAEESVRAGGSLKDRIRLLQQQQQQASEASDATPPAAPKPKREWKRPVAPPSADDLPPILGMKPPMPVRLPSKESDINEPGNEPGALDDSVLPSVTTLPDESVVADPDEEQEDIARRRRIAERMAKLGGAKMGFGIPGPVLGSKPPVPAKSPQSNMSEPSEENTNKIVETALPPDRIAIPAMPKRAGPPRRKPPATKPAEPAVKAEPEQIEGSRTEEAAGPSLVDTTDQSVVSAVETVPVDKLQPNPGDTSEISEYALVDAHSTSHQTSQSKDIKQKPDLQHSEDEEAPSMTAEDSGPVVASLDTPSHASEDPSAESIHVDSAESLEGGTPALTKPTFKSQPPHSPVLGLDSQALEADLNPTEDISGSVDHDGESEKVVSVPNSAPPPHDAKDLDESHEDGHLDTDEPQVIERDHDVRPLTDSRHATESRDLDKPPIDHTSIPLLSETPAPMANQPTVPPEDEDEASDVEHRQSFAKKMAVIGGRPMVPPISPRGEIRRPSGPREPKSPLTGVPIDESSPELGASNNEPLTQKLPSQSPLPPIPSTRPLPQPDLSSSKTAADSTRTEFTAKRSDSLDNSTSIAEPSVPEPVSSQDHQEDGEDEDEESARRRRLAERMAKMGGRPMMGGMMPMFSNSPSAARKPAAASQSGSHPLPSVPPPMNLASPPPIPSSRPLPPPPSGLITPSSEESASSPISVPSPPRRAAPSPMYRAPSSGLGQENDDFSRSPIESPSHMPSSPPPLSPAGRPKIPTAYQNPTKRSSTLSQPGHTWSHVDEPRSMYQEGVDEEEDHVPLSGSDDCGPPPVPPQRPPPVPGMSMGSPKPSTMVSDDPSRASFDSNRSSDPRSILTEKEGVISGSPRIPSMNTSGEGIRKVSHSSQFTHKARDLDLASERWWRTKPVSVPTSVQTMKDVLVRLQGSSTLQKGVSTYDYELIVIRDDYSKTVVRIHFEDGEDESATEMTQTHYPPPKSYPISTLQELNASIGPQLVARAKAREDEKGVKFVGAEEDGKTFVGMIVKSVGAALEPVGETFGEVIYKCEIQDFKAAHPEVDVKDDIKPGDIVASYGASFKGKGIGHGSMNLGTVTNAHVAIVAEHDVKKNKFKAYGVWHGKVELISYRIDELKSGSIKVFRVLDKKFLDN
ncbi:hypothetical protein DFH28DRAFT_944641 [Melampsora americana]|nr:hypothetical protein DFH28DRAFT_944641 [Melampsora americana]